MSMLLESAELFDPLAAVLADGMPVLGTCAGMILLSSEILDGRPDQRSFGVVDIAVRRNAFGRQVDSFEADLSVDGLTGGAFPAGFIRAPGGGGGGDGGHLLASGPDPPGACRQGALQVAAF